MVLFIPIQVLAGFSRDCTGDYRVAAINSQRNKRKRPPQLSITRKWEKSSMKNPGANFRT